jgi:uncharacterized membrane protein
MFVCCNSWFVCGYVILLLTRYTAILGYLLLYYQHEVICCCIINIRLFVVIYITQVLTSDMDQVLLVE